MPKTALLIPLIAFFLTIPFHAAVLLDQQNVVTVGPDLSLTALGADIVYSPAQVFTVGITGQLTRIDLQVWRASNTTLPLFVDLATTLNGSPRDIGTGVLATRSVSASGVALNPYPADPSFISFDFSSANIQVHAGDRLAIILRNSDADDNSLGYGYAWASTDQGSNTYPGGNAWNFGRPPHADGIFHETSTFPQAVQDQGFRTFVVIPVPLPSSLVAVLPLLILIALLKRREYNKGHIRAYCHSKTRQKQAQSAIKQRECPPYFCCWNARPTQATGAGAGKVTFNPFSITRRIDKASPILFLARLSAPSLGTLPRAGACLTSGSARIRKTK